MEEAKTVITDVQLEKLQKQQGEIRQALENLGVLEVQKHELLHNLAEASKGVEEFKKELEDEYGVVSINLSTGEYAPVEKADPEA